MKPYHYALTALAATACHWASAQMPIPTSASAATPAASAASQEPRFIRGNDRVIAPSAAGAPIVGAPSVFNFEETPVADVVRVVLGDILKVNYVLYPPLSGTVTLSTREAVAPDQAMSLLESALQANGLVLARDARGTYHVGRPEAVKGAGATSRQLVAGAVLQPGYGAIIVPLQFIGATEMATILRPLLPSDALARVDTVRNLLVLIGTRSQAEGWLDLVNTFDVDLLKGMSVGVFPLKYASVKEVEAALRLLSPGGVAALPSGSVGAGAPSGARAAAGAGAPTTGGGNALGEGSPLNGVLRIMPIERLNSVLVVTPRTAYLDEVRRWIERFDKPSDNTAEPQLFVYPVQNGSAKHLTDVLSGIFGGATSSASTTSPGTGVAPRLPVSTVATVPTTAGASVGSGGGVPTGSVGAATPAPRSNQPVVSASTLDSGVRVMADDRNNAVLIFSTRTEYNRIEAILKKLDAPATQVLIEASIIEVTLTDALKYGVQWMFNDSERGGLSGVGVFGTTRADGSLSGGTSGGFSYTLRNPLGNVRAVLNAIAGKTNLNVIASPSLMVLDNHTASISSGTQQPVNAGNTVGLGGVTTPNIQYRDTGVNLAVTPSVNAGDMVTMEINQSVTDVGATDTSTNTGSTGQPTFLQRQINSKVAIRSGDTIVLGGLIREKATSSDGGVPGLHRLPLIGALFGTKEKNLERTELLVVITPRVVRSDQAAREISQELRERMRGLAGVPWHPVGSSNSSNLAN